MAMTVAACAGQSGSIEGTVVNSVTGQGVPGVKVELTPANANTLKFRSATDSAGAFRFAEVTPGDYALEFDKDGFSDPEWDEPTTIVSVTAQGRVRLRKELDQLTAIEGKVLDSDNRGVKRTRVELLSGWGQTHKSVSTDDAGAFRVRNVHPGVYLLRATPNGLASLQNRPLLAPAYYPGVLPMSDASPILVNGERELAGYDIRMPTPATFAIRGRIVDSQGDAVAGVAVKLKSADTRYSYEGDPPDAQAISREQGQFEFAAVSAGHWHLYAVVGTLKGFAPVVLTRADRDDVTLRLDRPFALDITVDGPPASLFLLPVDGPQQQEVITKMSLDGKIRADTVYPGLYRSEESVPAGYYLDSILLGEQNVLGRDIELMEGTPPIRIVYKQGGATVRGTVDTGAGATVVLVPEASSPDHWRTAKCDDEGRFAIADLRPGFYFALAVRRASAAQDPGLARLVELQGTRLQVGGGEVKTEDLRLTNWPQ